jgi:hypothetical protein
MKKRKLGGLEDPHQLARGDEGCRVMLQRKDHAHSVESRSHRDLGVVDGQRSVHRHGERLPALVELPAVHAPRSLTKVDAGVVQQISRVLRPGVGCKVLRRADDAHAQVLRHAHRHHVLRDELADLDARIEPSRYEIDAAVRPVHLENDLRIVARELRELRDEGDHCGAAGQQDAHVARRPVAEAGDLVERLVNVAECRPHPCEELRPASAGATLRVVRASRRTPIRSSRSIEVQGARYSEASQRMIDR